MRRSGKKPAVGDQQCALPDPALDRVQKTGLEDSVLKARQLPSNCLSRYGFRLVLLETVAEYQRLIPAKDIWLYPPHKNFASEIC
jgi:hypothetical protein